MDSPTEDGRRSVVVRWAPWILAALIVLSYANSFRGAFLFDDFGSIVRNPALRTFVTAVRGSSRPLTDATFHMNYCLGGRAADFHLVNLAIHLTAALLLFGLARRVLARVPDGRLGPAGVSGCALCVSALWALHPVQTQSVTYIVQRAESLMGLAYLLTLYAVVRAAEAGPRAGAWPGVAIAACALGVLAKSVMVTAPLMALLLDRLFWAGTFRAALRARRGLYAGLAATWLALAAIVAVVAVHSTGIQPQLPSLFQYGRTQAVVVLHYLRLIVWPVDLCLDYVWPMATWGEAALPAVVVAAVCAASAWAYARRYAAGMAGLWFFIVLAPTSSFIPLGDMAFEHRLYLPLAGPVALAVGGLAWALAPRVRASVLAAAGVAVVVAAGALTVQRNAIYHSEETMWRDVVAKRPGNLRARIDLAVALAEGGKTREAKSQFEEALSRFPAAARARLDAGRKQYDRWLMPDADDYHYFRAQANLGMLLQKEGQADEALRHYAAALRIVPGDALVLAKAKELLRAQGVPADRTDEALQNLLRNGKGGDR